MRKSTLLASALLFGLSVSATARDIEGVVRDKTTGEPLIGSTVRVKGATTVTTSGLDGSFSLKGLPDEGKVTLVFSYLAYTSCEVEVNLSAADPLDVALEEASTSLGEAVVSAHRNQRTELGAIATVRNSAQVMNVMSAQSIMLSPDVNVANVLQRVSGVTMERDASGEASYAILRGMDKRYNYTLVNGTKIPSPDDKNRYIPLNIFPSDLMDRLVVTKSLTPDMEGDATGGVVNMVMKDAPSRFQLQANAAVGATDFFLGSQNYLSSNRSSYTHTAPYEAFGADYKASAADFRNGPTQVSSHSMPAPNFVGGLSVGDRFLDGKLGVIVAGSVQNTFRGTERTYNSVMMAHGEQAMYITKLQKRTYSIHDFNAGVHAKVDFTLNRHKFEWYNLYINQQQRGVRYNQTVSTEYGYDAEKGNYTQDDETRSLAQTQTVLATNLKGTHRFTDDFTVDWSGIYSRATEKDPDRTYLTLTNSVEGNAIVKTSPKSMERRFQHNTDKDWAGAFNAAYTSHFSHLDATWKAGAQYRRKERANRYYSYQFSPENISQKLNGNGFDQFGDINWTCSTPYSQASQLNYDSKEHIGGVYAMATLQADWGEIVGGFRAEHTNQIYTMLTKFKGMGQVGEQSYWDYLPSLSVKWKATHDMNVRLSYYRSINRPGFYEIVPYQIMGDDYMERGNPDLKRARIDNVDLRWEWFPSANEQVLVGVFYKRLHDPIEQVFVAPDGKIGSGTDAYYMPQNLGNATNYGIELDVVKYIRHFGVKANYTYTRSRITTTKRQYDLGGAEPKQVSQTRPLVNQAPHTANLSLLYRDTNHGWNAQLAASFTGNRLALVSPYKDADQWDRAQFSLDLSAEKRFSNGISVFLKANNLTDAKRERYLKTVNESNLSYGGQRSDRTVVGTYRYGRTFLLGVRYSL